MAEVIKNRYEFVILLAGQLDLEKNAFALNNHCPVYTEFRNSCVVSSIPAILILWNHFNFSSLVPSIILTSNS